MLVYLIDGSSQMYRAYHAMRSGKGGPVLVEVPPEVWEAEYKGELDYAPMPVQRRHHRRIPGSTSPFCRAHDTASS